MSASMTDEIREHIIKQIPVGRLGYASEIAAMASWLAADDAAYINGAVISINGGQYIANG